MKLTCFSGVGCKKVSRRFAFWKMAEPFKGMDLLHRSDDFQFISDEIEVKTFYEKASKILEGVDYDGQIGEVLDFCNKVQCSPTVAEELSHVCDVNYLKCNDEEEHDPLSSNIPTSSTLMTTEIQRRELEKRAILSYRQMQVQLQKFKRINWKVLNNYRDDKNKLVTPGYKSPDVLLTVYFTKPYNKPLERHEIRLGRLLTMDCAFYVLGHQKLSDLRDRINCLSDWGVLCDFSEDPSQTQDLLTKDKYKSGFFYINGVFYNDLRDESSIDLSQTVIDWAKKRPREIGSMSKMDMDKTTFMDLKIRLGQPYIYLHQGTCEHLMIFTDIRLLHPTDCLDPKEYPLQISYKMKKRAACCACKVYTARWVTFGHDSLPFDPGFFCDNCFFSFNYDGQMRKKGNFRAIPYFDRSVI